MWWMLVAMAFAEVPAEVRPAVVGVATPEAYAAFASKRGMSETALACDTVWGDEALLCWRLITDTEQRWVTTADLARWDVDRAGLRAEVVRRSVELVATAGELKPVEDMEASYWLSAAGDGWAALALLHPDALASRLKARPLMVATPNIDVTLAWAGGNAEVDTVMAVGVREMFEQQRHPITAVVHRWSDGAWKAFGEAVRTEKGPPKR